MPHPKRCAKCGVVKAPGEFSQDRSRSDGLASRCRACRSQDMRDRRDRRATRLREIERASSTRYRAAHPGNVPQRGYYARCRKAVFDHYGWACACCGSTDRPTIDHVNGDGREHRAADPNASKLYRWLVLHGFPAGFQTLCMPCNNSKHGGLRCRLDHTERELSDAAGLS